MSRWQIVYIVGKLKSDVTNKISEISTTFSKQILSEGLLLVNISCRFNGFQLAQLVKSLMVE